MHETHLNNCINEEGILESDFAGTIDDALKMIAFSVHLLSNAKNEHHLEILSAVRGLLENGEFMFRLNNQRLN